MMIEVTLNVSLISGILFPVLLTLRHNTYSVFLAVSAVMGLSIAPLPTVTSGVITNILGADKLNDAFGEDKVVAKYSSVKTCVFFIRAADILEGHLCFPWSSHRWILGRLSRRLHYALQSGFR